MYAIFKVTSFLSFLFGALDFILEVKWVLFPKFWSTFWSPSPMLLWVLLFSIYKMSNVCWCSIWMHVWKPKGFIFVGFVFGKCRRLNGCSCQMHFLKPKFYVFESFGFQSCTKLNVCWSLKAFFFVGFGFSKV